MSSGCGDVLSLEDLRIAKLHQIFEAEVITGRQGGVAGAAVIDYATNLVTGQTQKTLPAILRDAGFSPTSFDFTSGGVLGVNDRDKVVFDPVSKTWYSWLGALPHTIPAGTNPVSDANWKPQTDPDLREDLAAPNGVDLVNGAVSKAKYEDHPITSMDSYDAANVTPAFLESKSKYGFVYFPGKKETFYNLPVGTQAAQMANTTIYADDGAVIQIENYEYDFLKTLNIKGRCRFFITPLNYKFYVHEIPQYEKQPSIDYEPVEIKSIPWAACRVYSINLDTFTDTGAFSSNDHSAYFSVPTNTLTGLFTQIETGEAISASFSADLGNVERLGVVLRCTNGYLLVSSVPGALGPWQYTYKTIGGGYSSPVAIATPDGDLLSYAAGKASAGASLQSKTVFNLILNGVSTGLPIDVSTLGSGLGEIAEIGFVASNVAANDFITLSGMCSYVSKHGVLGKAPLDIAIYGDSTAAPYLMSFGKYLPALLDGKMGTRTVNIYNYAVAGQSMGQQVAILKANPPNAQIIIMAGGTNEAQGDISGDFFNLTMTDFINFCLGRGATPLWIEPYMWYPKEFINGSGQTVIENYAGAARIREVGKRLMANLGNRGICVTTTHQMPAPLPKYFNDYPTLDPLLRDGLHQTELTFKLYAEAVANALLKWLVKVDKTPMSIPAWLLGTGVTASTSSLSRTLVDATLAKTSFAENDVLFTLPRWANPGRLMRVPVTWSSASSAGSGYATIDTAGVVRGRIVTGANTIYLHAALV